MNDIIEEYLSKLSELVGNAVGIVMIFTDPEGNNDTKYVDIPTIDKLKSTLDYYGGFKDAGGLNSIRIEIVPADNKHESITSFMLTTMPGCCGACVSSNVVVNPNYREKGVNNLTNRLRVRLAKALDYGLLVCTTQMSNYSTNTLKSNNWKTVEEFTNPKTSNRLGLHIYNLKDFNDN